MRLNNKKYGRCILVASYVMFGCFSTLTTSSQIKSVNSILRESIHGFSKIGASAISEIIDISDIEWDVTYIKATDKEYAEYSRIYGFSPTPAYIVELDDRGEGKYITKLSQDPQTRIKVRLILDSFEAVPYIAGSVASDRNGHIAFASASMRKPLTGDHVIDSKNCMELSILQWLASGRLEACYAGGFVYLSHDMSFTRYPITSKGMPWGNVIIFYDEEEFDSLAAHQRERALWMCVAFMVVGAAISIHNSRRQDDV